MLQKKEDNWTLARMKHWMKKGLLLQRETKKRRRSYPALLGLHSMPLMPNLLTKTMRSSMIISASNKESTKWPQNSIWIPLNTQKTLWQKWEKVITKKVFTTSWMPSIKKAKIANKQWETMMDLRTKLSTNNMKKHKT